MGDKKKVNNMKRIVS